jgi:osmotically-inducible protein OsmY
MNKLQRKTTVLIAAALLALAGCATNPEKGSASAYFNDTGITTRVKTAIFNEPGLKTMNISVKTQDQVVQLSGSVKTRADKVKLAEVARKVDGVKLVKNDVQVKQ